MDFTTVDTGCKALNWMLQRLTVTDLSDKNGKFLLGEFKGQLPYHMAQQVKEFAIKNGGDRTGTLNVTLIDEETRCLCYNVSFGKTRSSADKVTFAIKYYQD